MTIFGFLRLRGENQDRYGDPIPALAAIDQVGELLSSLPQRQRFLMPFMGELAEAPREHQGLRLLLSLREDYLAAVLPFEQFLGGQSRTRSRLLPFGQDAALEATRRPLEGIGRSFEPGAAEGLVADLRTITVTDARGEHGYRRHHRARAGSDRLLGVVGFRSGRRHGLHVVACARARRRGQVPRELCRRALSAVVREHGMAAARIRSWLQQTFITEPGTRGTACEGICGWWARR